MTDEPLLYDELCRQVDDQVKMIKKANLSQINCRKGCSSCCHNRLYLFKIEFDRLKKAYLRLSQPLKTLIKKEADLKWQQGTCPLLVDGACSLYDIRPIICRTHGYPLQSKVRTKNQSQISVCELNFQGTRSYNDEDLIDVDEVGMILIGANREYVNTHHATNTDNETRPMLDVVR